jgi:type IV pilus assembly protein PilN
MRRINLLPSEDRRRGVTLPAATRSSILGVLLILGALLLLVMIGLYLYYYVRLGNEEEQITQLDQDIAREQARIQELAPFRDLQARLDAKKPIADGIFRTRFPWDEFLRGLSFVIPESTALDIFAGQATPINIQAPAGGAPEVQNLEPPGTITFNGFAQPAEYQNVSDFIVRMNNLRFLANADLTSAELDRQNFPQPGAITFEVDAELVTRIGENGDEVLLGTEENGEGEADEGDGAASEGDAPPGARASRAEVGR